MQGDTKALLQLATHLKNHGHSLTKPRRIIFEALLNSEAQSMHDLTKALVSQLDRASLYRTVSLFEELGVVRRVHIGWKYKLELSDAFSPHHHHMICVGCGKLQAFAGSSDIEELLDTMARHHHFQPIKHTLEIEGYCQDCQKKYKPGDQPIPHAHHNHGLEHDA